MNNTNPAIQRCSSDSQIEMKLKESQMDSAKSKYEDLTRRYLLMLTKGCGDMDCRFKLCASCSSSKKMDIQKATVLSLSLASKPSIILCPNIISRTKAEIESELFEQGNQNMPESSTNGISTSFLSRMISFSKLSHIFSPNPSESQNAFHQRLKIEDKHLIQQQNNTRSLSDVKMQLEKEQNLKKPFKIVSVQESSPDEVDQRPEYLKDDIWRQLITEYQQDPQKVVDVIKTIFSSRTRLGKSFLLQNSSKKSPLDLTDLEQFYSSVLSMDDNKVLETEILNSIELLLVKLDSMLSVDDYSTYRIILILLHIPHLASNEPLQRKLAKIISRLQNKTTLCYWLSLLTSSRFKSILNIFKKFVAENFRYVHHDAVESSFKLLQIFFESNLKSTTVKISDFYVSEISLALDFKKEFINWNNCRRTSKFSFFKYPFIFDPIAKSRIMHLDALCQMSGEFEEAYVTQALVFHAQKFLENNLPLSELERKMKMAANPFLVLEIRRNYLIEDSIDQLRQKSSDLKKAIRIKFVDSGEEGMDQGGVQKEFFHIILTQLLDIKYGLFVYDEHTRFNWINASALESTKYFELVGIIIGLAMYNGVMLGISFPSIFYKKVLEEEVNFSDFMESFPQLGSGLDQLLSWPHDDVEEVFQRCFEISIGKFKTVPLIENGENISVTNRNRKDFVNKYVDYYVNKSVENQFNALKRGLLKIYGNNSLNMCHSSELEMIICGNNSNDVNFQELKDITKYDDGYNLSHEVIRWFWSIFESFSLDHKKKLLLFVTASDRIPLNGLKSLTFIIQRNGPDSHRLPTALTCFGRLLLPEYNSKEKLEKLLIIAIENAAGFGLV